MGAPQDPSCICGQPRRHYLSREEIPAALITDNGATEFKGVPTNTVAAIGPASDDVLKPITGHLKLL